MLLILPGSSGRFRQNVIKLSGGCRGINLPKSLEDFLEREYYTTQKSKIPF